MAWKKKGLIYVPNGSMDWALTHAQLPVGFFLDDDTVRVIVCSRDSQSRSLPGYVDIDANDLSKIKSIAEQPILELGGLGEFDDCGVMPSWVIGHKGLTYMYYVGWNVRNTIAYHNAVGLALSEDGGKTFKKFSNGPLWERDFREPHYSGTSCIIIEDNGVWRNWYLSCTEWRVVKGRTEPRYHIKIAESTDGINWVRKGKIAIDYLDDEEAGIVKASVIKEDGIYKMWFGRRRFTDYRTDPKSSYRIGYAESSDGENWIRKDGEAGIDVGPEEWDSLMIEYPHVMEIRNELVMFYNGNGFGKSGFGYAVRE